MKGKVARERGWHFCDGMKLRDGTPLVVGKTYKVTGPLEMCEHGLHWSKRLIDALRYAPGATICEVEAWGGTVRGDDKCVSRYRKVLRVVDGTRLLHEASCHFAEEALKAAKVEDKRCWEAIACKRRWLDGKATDEELGAARSAARSAAESAAWGAARSVQNRYLTAQVRKAMRRSA